MCSFLIWGAATVFYFLWSTLRKRNLLPWQPLFLQSRVQLEKRLREHHCHKPSLCLTNFDLMVALMSKKKQTMKNEFILKVALMSAPHFEGPSIFFFCEFTTMTNIEEENSSELVESWSTELDAAGAALEPHSSSSRHGVCFNLCHWLIGLGRARRAVRTGSYAMMSKADLGEGHRLTHQSQLVAYVDDNVTAQYFPNRHFGLHSASDGHEHFVYYIALNFYLITTWWNIVANKPLNHHRTFHTWISCVWKAEMRLNMHNVAIKITVLLNHSEKWNGLKYLEVTMTEFRHRV